MKKGVNGWCFDADTDAASMVRLARDAGFDGLELNLEERDLEGSLSRFEEARTLARDLGIELPSVATDLYWRYPLSSADAAIHQRAAAILVRQLEAARRAGAGAILVVPGVVTPNEPYDAVYERALRALKEAAPRAEEMGVVIAVEEVWNKFLLSPLEFAGFVDAVGSPAVKAYFDVGNVLLFGYPEQWIRILQNRIARVHVKDFLTSVGTMAGFTHLLQGDVDWRRVMTALREVGYDGYLTCEIPPYPHVRGNLSLPALKAGLDRIFELT